MKKRMLSVLMAAIMMVSVLLNIILAIEATEFRIIGGKSITLSVGESVELKTNLKSTSKPILKWKTSDETIATVDKNGKVSSITAGTVKITVQIEKKYKATCHVKVLSKEQFGYMTKEPAYKQLIPIIEISTENQAGITNKDEYISGTFSLICDDNSLNVNTTELNIKGRGHSTWKWDKKPYKLKFPKKISIMGMKSAKDWVLLANYSDPSLLRNVTAFETAKIADNLPFVPTQMPVDLYLNGKYHGVYSIGEQIEIKSGRIEPDEDAGISYLLEAGGAEEGYVIGKDSFNVNKLTPIAIKEPDPKSDLTKGQFKFIQNYCIKAENAIVNNKRYEDLIDVPSFVDWFIVNELFYNLDGAANRSFYLLKENDEKFKIATIWDFDLAFGNYIIDPKIYENWAETYEVPKYHNSDNWFAYLLKSERFNKSLKERWNEIKGPLYKAAIASIDKNSKSLQYSQKFNFEKWDILGERVGFQSTTVANLTTFDMHVKYLKDFLSARYDFMDKKINAL